jgi:hypothetical protein
MQVNPFLPWRRTLVWLIATIVSTVASLATEAGAALSALIIRSRSLIVLSGSPAVGTTIAVPAKSIAIDWTCMAFPLSQLTGGVAG